MKISDRAVDRVGYRLGLRCAVTAVQWIGAVSVAVSSSALAGTGSNVGGYGTNAANPVVVGRVADASDAGVAGAIVRTSAGLFAVTDVNGNYTLTLDAPGGYAVTVSFDGGSSSPQAVTVAFDASVTLNVVLAGSSSDAGTDAGAGAGSGADAGADAGAGADGGGGGANAGTESTPPKSGCSKCAATPSDGSTSLPAIVLAILLIAFARLRRGRPKNQGG